MRLTVISYFYACLFWCLLVSPVQSQVISGRTSVGQYMWGRDVPADGQQTYYRIFQGSRLQIKGQKRKNIAFHISYRLAESFGDYTGKDYGNKLYNVYLAVKDIHQMIDFNLGRQYMFAGVGYGAMDGLKIKIRMQDYVAVTAYAGVLVPIHESFQIDTWKESHMFGFELKTHRFYDSDLAISYTRQERDLEPFRNPGSFSGRTVHGQSLEHHLIGLDFRKQLHQTFLMSTRLEGDITYKGEREFDRAEVYTRYQPADQWFLSGEYYYRKPRIRKNSIFSVFRQYDNQELWMKATYRVSDNLSYYGGISGVFYEDESAARINVGVQSALVTVNVFKNIGYAGALDGISGGIFYPLKPTVTVTGGLYLSRYKLFEEADDFDNLASSYWGVIWQPAQHWDIHAEGQALHNKIFSSDMRFFLRISRRFYYKLRE